MLMDQGVPLGRSDQCSPYNTPIECQQGAAIPLQGSRPGVPGEHTVLRVSWLDDGVGYGSGWFSYVLCGHTLLKDLKMDTFEHAPEIRLWAYEHTL